MNMKDKVAIVAGGGRDIGKATALELAARGAKVAVVYHSSADGANEAVETISANGGSAVAVQADLTDGVAVAGLITAVQEAFGGTIDSLVHVTGGLIARKKLGEMDEAFWHQVMDVNVTSMFLLAQAVVPHMSEGGTIVALSSQAGRDGGGPGALAYATSKGAVMTMTRALAKELGPAIRVNAICPGMIDTTFHDTFTKDEVRKNVAGATALKREGTSEDVAKLAVFLASDDSAYMTGNCVDINGGISFS